MKRIIFISFILFAHVTLANGPTQEQALETSKQFYGLLASPKVSGVGIGFCDSFGNKLKDFDQPKNICILIKVIDASTAASIKKIFPPGTRIEDTFVSVEIQGFGVPH